MRTNNNELVTKEHNRNTGTLYTYETFKEKMEEFKKDGRYEMAKQQAENVLPKLYKRYMNEIQENIIIPVVCEDTEKLFAAVREQIERVPYLNKPKCYKTFILNLILNSGLEYGYVMSYLDSLNAYDENDKGWKMIDLNMSIEEKFDILGWEKVVKKLIVWATSDSYSLAA